MLSPELTWILVGFIGLLVFLVVGGMVLKHFVRKGSISARSITRDDRSAPLFDETDKNEDEYLYYYRDDD
ncbi:hypothetical protein TK90_2696 (plasmid) [Thioalkalivibrio sp. K90mix]|uniref:hypothetical protein n=1 Tax=Thioalkalivibrio sp. (strain K90mix) TaxID=396595 RepID=UPI000195A449|nr:hypothetical protein [Thioalkalivibrio sp. K90mix]ADC73182.1 hypothetical protein TK90_2696 [Thioalkalivibrio sp. K90mix]